MVVAAAVAMSWPVASVTTAPKGFAALVVG